jgi:hypothetical protein
MTAKVRRRVISSINAISMCYYIIGIGQIAAISVKKYSFLGGKDTKQITISNKKITFCD